MKHNYIFLEEYRIEGNFGDSLQICRSFKLPCQLLVAAEIGIFYAKKKTNRSRQSLFR